MRSIRTTQERIEQVSGRAATDRTSQAFLAAPLVAGGRVVSVQFSDPAKLRGSAVQASVRAGLTQAALAAGTPVMVNVRHGKVEIIGLPNQAAEPVAAGQGAITTRSTNQSITNDAAPEGVAFTTNVYITDDAFHSTTDDQEQLVAAAGTGWYHVEAFIKYIAPAAIGRYRLRIRDSAAADIAVIRVDTATSGNDVELSVSADVYLTSGDWVDIATAQTSGAARNVGLARASIRYVGA